MPRSKEQSLWAAIGEALNHTPSIASVLLSTLLLSVSSPWGLLEIKAHELASLVFPVAGTIVALALTAAGLASTFIGKLSDQMSDVYTSNAFTKEARALAIINRARELKKGIFPAWRGSVFVLCSFILSGVALIVPAGVTTIGKRVTLAWDSIFSVSALACLIVGSLWFLPTVRFSFRGALLERVLRSAEGLRGSSAPTVADLFRRAEVLRRQHPRASYKEIGNTLREECVGRPFPSPKNIAITEAEHRAPVEESSAGLPLIKRGIDCKDWGGVCEGIVLTLELIEKHEHEHGSHHDDDAWHDRLRGIRTATETGISKWMPGDIKPPV